MFSCSLGGGRLVCHVFENFGGPNNILYLIFFHEKNCIMDISKGKLDMTPIRMFEKVRAWILDIVALENQW